MERPKTGFKGLETLQMLEGALGIENKTSLEEIKMKSTANKFFKKDENNIIPGSILASSIQSNYPKSVKSRAATKSSKNNTMDSN